LKGEELLALAAAGAADATLELAQRDRKQPLGLVQ